MKVPFGNWFVIEEEDIIKNIIWPVLYLHIHSQIWKGDEEYNEKKHLTYWKLKMKSLIFVTFFVVLLILPENVRSDFGGHDLFTSLAQLEVLWHNDREVVKEMENTIVKLERAKKSLERQVFF